MSHLMKASALKNSGETNKNENYPTPLSLIRKMVKQAISTKHWNQYDTRGKGVKDTPVRVLDLCAGNAAWGIIAKQELEKYGFTVHLTAIEIDETILPAPEVDEWIQADFRDVQNLEPFDFIFSNPPFSLVYEITAWSCERLTGWGIFTLLIGSNFMFAQTMLNKHLKDIHPLLEIKWTRRPSFIHLFSEKAYGEEVRKTNAKDYCGYYFAGRELYNWIDSRMPYHYLMLPADSQPWITFTQYWEYEEDPLQAVIEMRPVTVQQALIREAAEAKKGDPLFDDYWSLMACNSYGWGFYHADFAERAHLRACTYENEMELQLGYDMSTTVPAITYKEG